MNTNPPMSKVSMVIPVYNKKDDIAVMLDSIINQVWDNIELIMVNDGSTDGTRDVLDKWIPRFKERGYTVNIIDQENQGISAAVRNGMLKMTGDYFCSVDCDDYLYPEYVSTMASWLDEHQEYDYAACGYERAEGTKDNWVIRTADLEKSEALSSSNLIENMLFFRTHIASWVYLVRRAYLEKCRIIENFVTELRIWQEPSISFPLAMGCGLLKYFPSVLYRFHLFDRKQSLEDRFPSFAEKYTQALRMVIKAFPLHDSEQKNKLLFLCDFFQVKFSFIDCENYHNRRDEKKLHAEKLTALVNNYFEPSPNITPEEILNTGYKPLCYILENSILGIEAPSIKDELERLSNARVVCYGVLGRASKSLSMPLFETKLKPDIFWDIAANGEIINGLPVEKPNFPILTENDVFIFLPLNSSVAQQVKPELNKIGVKKTINHFQLLQYLGECFYPYFDDKNHYYSTGKWRAY